jgi:rubredoxin
VVNWPGLCSMARYNSTILRQRPSVTMSETKTWMCLICGWIYDEAAGDPEHGVAPGTAWADVPMNWTCPECGARKEDFEMVEI